MGLQTEIDLVGPALKARRYAGIGVRKSKVSEDPVLGLAPDSEGDGVPLRGNVVLKAGSVFSLVSTPIFNSLISLVFLLARFPRSAPREVDFCNTLLLFGFPFLKEKKRTKRKERGR